MSYTIHTCATKPNTQPKHDYNTNHIKVGIQRLDSRNNNVQMTFISNFSFITIPVLQATYLSGLVSKFELFIDTLSHPFSTKTPTKQQQNSNKMKPTLSLSICIGSSIPKLSRRNDSVQQCDK